MHVDDAIAAALDAMAREVGADAASPRGSVMQGALGAPLSDDAHAALAALIDAPEGEEALRAVVDRALGAFLWRLAIAVDERRTEEGVVLGLFADGRASEGSLHEAVMGRLVERGLD